MLSPAYAERFVHSLPDRPWCKTHKSGHWYVRSKSDVHDFELVQPNHPEVIRWLPFDLDEPQGVLAWERIECRPNIAVINRENGHAHLLYELDKPVYDWKHVGRPTRALRFYSAVHRGLTMALKADPGYSGTLVKNPLHKAWEAHVLRESPYTLAELSRYVDLGIPVGVTVTDFGRNCSIFHQLRHWAYRNCERASSYESFLTECTIVASGYNTFAMPLSRTEIQGIAKSVAKWVWSRYEGSGRPYRGVMGLDPSLPLVERQKLSGAFVASRRKASSLDRISQTIALLRREGKKVTCSSVANRSGLGIATVKRHWRDAFETGSGSTFSPANS